jgi:hypothetical protein
MRAAFHDSAVLQHKDLVGRADSGQAVCDHQCSPAVKRFLHCCL